MNEKPYIDIRWTTDDVAAVRPDLTEEQAADVLAYVLDNHDANLGVTWDTLSYAADVLFGSKEES